MSNHLPQWTDLEALAAGGWEVLGYDTGTASFEGCPEDLLSPEGTLKTPWVVARRRWVGDGIEIEFPPLPDGW